MTKASRVPVIGIQLIGVICPSARVSAQQRPAIADQIAKTYGLDSWDQVEAIRYTFNVDWPALRLKTSRSWAWEPKTDRVSSRTWRSSWPGRTPGWTPSNSEPRSSNEE